MKKFLELNPELTEIDILEAYPDYDKLLNPSDGILRALQDQLSDSASPQVLNEYNELINSIDEFLNRPEEIKKMRVLHPDLIISGLDYESKVNEDTAKEILNEEIDELVKNIDTNIIEAQIKSVKSQRKSAKIILDDLKEITRDMINPENQYWGGTYKYDEVIRLGADRAFCVLKLGLKYKSATFGSKHYVVLSIDERSKIVIETAVEITDADNIVSAVDKDMSIYILSKDKEKIDYIYNIFKTAFRKESEELGSIIDLTDEFLYNNPLMIGVFQDGFMYQEADILSQNPKYAFQQKMYPENFAVNYPLDKMLTLCLIRRMVSKQLDFNVDEFKKKVEENIDTHTYRYEGIGDVPKRKNILKELQSELYIDEGYELTSKGKAIASYNGFLSIYGGVGTSLHPSFQPSQYMIADIKSSFKKSKTRYYSVYNGTTVYYREKNQSSVSVAFPLTNKQIADFGMNKAIQGEAFSQSWQANQQFKHFAEYVPVSSTSNIKVEDRASESGVRKIEGKILFSNRVRFDLGLVCITDVYLKQEIDASVFNYVKQMYKGRKLRILGPDYTTRSGNFFFHIVDEKNNLLAIIPPQKVAVKNYSKTMTDIASTIFDSRTSSPNFDSKTKGTTDVSDYQTEIVFETAGDFQMPEPVWSYKEIEDEIMKIAPDVVLNGVEIKDAGGLTTSVEMETTITSTDIIDKPLEDVIDITPGIDVETQIKDEESDEEDIQEASVQEMKDEIEDLKMLLEFEDDKALIKEMKDEIEALELMIEMQ